MRSTHLFFFFYHSSFHVIHRLIVNRLSREKLDRDRVTTINHRCYHYQQPPLCLPRTCVCVFTPVDVRVRITQFKNVLSPSLYWRKKKRWTVLFVLIKDTTSIFFFNKTTDSDVLRLSGKGVSRLPRSLVCVCRRGLHRSVALMGGGGGRGQ